ncbi:DUF4190 domain-containing protein [Lapillicoccus jejuensis]|uniref:DUF4190 domain-containing protein n=1 Tax=Lapillicoccus jejuensis TaxID=402171 RepID=A0A542DZT5_9MICO|nr:DUF4190 domain-containing protein [Lapillicoccus jejuensis]TQJ08583.1 hypothetical protein FB458_1673 [Lapillicoccus jejuensis]
MTTPQDSRPGEPLPSYHRDPASVTNARTGPAVAAFVVGVFSVVAVWPLGPLAIVLANRALRAVDAGEVPADQRTLAVVGRVLGIVGTVLLGLAVVALVVALVFFLAVASRSQAGT